MVEISEKEHAERPINIYWPRAGIKGKLNANESQTLAILCKIEPTATLGAEAGLTEISKLNFNIKVKQIGEPKVEPSALPEEYQQSNIQD